MNIQAVFEITRLFILGIIIKYKETNIELKHLIRNFLFNLVNNLRNILLPFNLSDRQYRLYAKTCIISHL